MRGFGDTSLADLPELRSVGEMAAFALALEREAARRFSALAQGLRAIGDAALADLTEELADEHVAQAERHETDAKRSAREGLDAPGLSQLMPRGLTEIDPAVCALSSLTQYQVLAVAVELAQQSFALYSYLAATADKEVRGLAEALASEELAHTARLRARRRRAYHAERGRQGSFPAARLVESLADLLAAAKVMEDRLAQRLAAAGFDASETSERTEGLVHALQQASEPSGPMAADLARFALVNQSSVAADRTELMRQVFADCEQAFTFYDAVASAPVDESVMLRAQDLSRAALERIRQIRGLAGGF